MKKVVIEGKEYVPTLFVIKKRKVKARGREYWQYYINVPKEIGEWVESQINTEFNAYPIVALIRPAEWYHILNWDEVGPYLKERLPQKIKKELQWLGFLKETE